ncbi:hypothetical protein [Halopenitus persicus]|uniref:Uncharacterized protein n=1 Tax=Halopenitus persicus TaxID=1048396 RepID=A0A1H3NWF9_9EURY|nr:hypothetical protein [Halopenitus persicus]SDY93188.1 hypothetical protein SAMN05216564_11612 [Halopenitus persicus]
MTSDLRSRLILLVVLAVLGVGLAVIGTTVGATTTLTDSGPGAAFVVSEDNVTFEHGDQQATVLDNMSRVDSIEIEQQNSGTYQVNTEAEDPLTDSDRSRAKAIARNNATVQKALQNLDQYELTVDPIHKLTVDSARTTTFTGLNNTSMDSETPEGEETFTLTVEETDETGTVTIDRDPEYVEDEVVVRIHDPAADEMYYSITVDLENETVTDITDWRSD